MFEIIRIFLSDALFTLIVPGIALGLLAITISFFIPLSFIVYKVPLQIGGLILVMFFVFQSGRNTESVKYKTQALKDKVLISELSAKSSQITTDTIVKYVDRVKVVEKIKEVPVNVYVTKETDSKCVIDAVSSNSIARLLNAASEGRVPESAGAFNGPTK